MHTMKFTIVLLLLVGLSASYGHLGDGGHVRINRGGRSANCGRVVISPEDQSQRTRRCWKVLKRKLKENYHVAVQVDKRRRARRGALDVIFLDKDDQCRDVVEEALENIGDKIKMKYAGRAWANRCHRTPIRSTKSSRRRSSTSAKSTTKSSKQTTSKSSDKSRKTTDCRAPRYEVLHGPATCEEVLSGNNTNSYWDKEDFLCRTRRRPCKIWPEVDRLDMLLSGGFHIKMQMGISGATWPSNDDPHLDPVEGVGGPSEVWAIRTDGDGNLKILPWNSNYYFYSEGGWVEGSNFRANTVDWNDYQFGSLDCNRNRGKWDDEDFLFIIIDGVLVDSCPPYLAEDCRACDA